MKEQVLIEDLINWIKKWLKRVRVVAIIILIAFLFLLIIINRHQRNQINNETEIVANLKLQNEILLTQIASRDTAVIYKERVIQKLTDSIEIEKRKKEKLQKENKILNKALSEIADELIKITADSSYRFLTEIAYPLEGEKKYPFNELQVKEIHHTYVEKVWLHHINANLIGQNWSMELQINMQDKRYEEARNAINLYIESKNDADKVIENQEQIIQIQDKRIAKEYRQKNIWKVATGIAFLVGLII